MTAQPLRQLWKLLAPTKPALWHEVELAIGDPDAYVARFAARLNERGIDRPRPDLRWIALADALGAAKRLAEIDGRATPEDVIASLGRLVSKPRGLSMAWFAGLDLGVAHTDECIEHLGGEFAKRDLGLIELLPGTDSFSLAIIASRDVKSAIELARRAGGSIKPFTGADAKSRATSRQARTSDKKRRANRAKRTFLRGAGRDTEVWILEVDGNQVMIFSGRLARSGKLQTLRPERGRKQALVRKLLAEHAKGWRRVPYELYELMDAAARRKEYLDDRAARKLLTRRA